eukprot:g4786.t1
MAEAKQQEMSRNDEGEDKTRDASKTNDSSSTARRAIVISSAVPDADKIADAVQKGVVIVRSDYNKDTVFTIHKALVEASKNGGKFDSIGFLEHGKASTMQVTKTCALNSHTWIMNTYGVRDFMMENAKLLKKGGRIDFLSCNFSKKPSCDPCNRHLFTNMEKETGIDFAASGTGFGKPSAKHPKANLILETDQIDAKAAYFTDVIDDWNHALGIEEAICDIFCQFCFGCDLEAVHGEEYIEKVNNLAREGSESLAPDTYHNEHTADAAKLAAGSVVAIVETVMDRSSSVKNGFAIVRPPGHHCQACATHGFCIFNNVAVAARAAQKRFGAKRVFILDWDVHHGDGTELIFRDDPSVLYVSLHRFENGAFFPHTGAPAECGRYGRSVHVAWSQSGMENDDYRYAFEQLVLPVAQEFKPDLVLVSAGFDAAAGDPLGGMHLTRSEYAYMTCALCTRIPSAKGRVVLALEGGYSLSALCPCAEACVRTLMRCAHDEKLSIRASAVVHPLLVNASAVRDVGRTVSNLAPFWSSLRNGTVDDEKKKELQEDAEDLQGSKLPAADASTTTASLNVIRVLRRKLFSAKVNVSKEQKGHVEHTGNVQIEIWLVKGVEKDTICRPSR